MIEAQAVDPSVSKRALPLNATDLHTVCVLCSHNCGLLVDVADGRITDVRADPSSPITEGYVCNKGFSIGHYVHHAQRLEHPLRRRPDGTFERVSWEDAVGEIASRLSTIRETHGGRAIGFVGFGGQGNHLGVFYGLSFMRAVGSQRWFNAYAQEKTQHHLIDFWMFDAPPTCFFYPDEEHTKYLLTLGSNPKISNRGHNATDTYKKLHADPTRRLTIADPRITETTRQADRHLRVRPGTDVYLLLGIAATIVQKGLVDEAFVRDRTIGFDGLRPILAEVDVTEMARRCGIPLPELVATATEFATAETAAIAYDLAVEQTWFSTLISYLIRVIVVITGNAGRIGGQIFLESVAPPNRDAERFAEPERALASGIPGIRALGNWFMFSPNLVPEEIMVDHPERIRALMIDSTNPFLSFADTAAWRAARAKLDLMVVIEVAMTETAREADFVLPAPVGYEKWEIAAFPKAYPAVPTQLRPPVVPGPREALPEGEIYARLAEAMNLFGEAPGELHELAAAAHTAEGAQLFFMRLSELAREAGDGRGTPRMLYWAYRTLGPHLESPQLVQVWVQMLLNVMSRPESVLRTLGETWRGRNPFEIALELFRRVMAHPEGVEVARTDPATCLEDNIGFADKKIRVAPEPMLGEIRRAMDTAPQADPEYPFMLASGLRTRWNANTIQRDPKWRKGRGPHCALHLSPADAARLAVASGDELVISTRRGSVRLPAEVDRNVTEGHVWMPNGFGMAYPKDESDPEGELVVQGANPNELTDAADRDPFTGCPHHKAVRCRLEKAA
jgi:anaerobic selenocysteine-containing dehydrogenase